MSSTPADSLAAAATAYRQERATWDRDYARAGRAWVVVIGRDAALVVEEHGTLRTIWSAPLGQRDGVARVSVGDLARAPNGPIAVNLADVTVGGERFYAEVYP